MYNRQESEEVLTPAARQLLEELVDDYRAQLFAFAEASASRLTGDVREVSVHDVLAGLDRVQRRPIGRRSVKVERLLLAYAVTGAMLMVASVTFWLLQYSWDLANLEQRLPLMIGAAGSIIFLTSVLAIRLRNLRTVELETSVGQTTGEDNELIFVTLWRDIEISLRQAAASELGESASSGPISALLEAVVRSGRLTKDDGQTLRRLIAVRNKIVHGVAKFSEDEMQTAIREAYQILKKLPPDANAKLLFLRAR